MQACATEAVSATLCCQQAFAGVAETSADTGADSGDGRYSEAAWVLLADSGFGGT